MKDENKLVLKAVVCGTMAAANIVGGGLLLAYGFCKFPSFDSKFLKDWGLAAFGLATTFAVVASDYTLMAKNARARTREK